VSTSFRPLADPSHFLPFVHQAKFRWDSSRHCSASAGLLRNCASSSWAGGRRNFLQSAKLLCIFGMTTYVRCEGPEPFV
jgi:hypothetical protein